MMLFTKLIVFSYSYQDKRKNENPENPVDPV